MCLRHHERITLPARFALAESVEDTAKRRELVVKCFEHLSPEEASMLAWRWDLPDLDGQSPSRFALVSADDFEWSMALIDGPSAEHVATLLPHLFDPLDPQHVQAAYERLGHARVADALGHNFEAVLLESDKAVRLKANLTKPSRGWAGLEDHKEVVTSAWRSLLSEDGAFVRLDRLLRIDPKTGRPARLFAELAWPSRSLLPASDDELAIACASWLTSVVPQRHPWFAPDRTFRISTTDAIAHAALMHIAVTDEVVPVRLSDDVLAAWTPVIIGLSVDFQGMDSIAHTRLVGQSKDRVPDVFCREYTNWVIEKLVAGFNLPSLEPLQCDGLDDAIESLFESVDQLVLEIVELSVKIEGSGTDDEALRGQLENNRALRAIALASLGQFLVSKGHPASRQVFEAQLVHADASVRTASILAMLEGGALSWSAFLSDPRMDDPQRRRVVVAMAGAIYDGPSLGDAAEAEIALLWRWLAQRWPPEDDTWPSGAVTEDQQVQRWRNACIQELSIRGTAEATSELVRLAEERPGDYRILQALQDAERRESDDAWEPVTFSELRLLAADSRRTIVNSDEDLYQLVLRSIERFRLYVADLGHLMWDEIPPSAGTDAGWRPKPEAAVSDMLRTYLELDLSEGVVVNREVQVRATTSSGHGLSVDVFVSGGDRQSGRRMPQCPIEVKGSWNRDLLTSIETQLVVDYMTSTRASRGIYLCAWYPTEFWTSHSGSGRSEAFRRNRDNVEAALMALAAGLGTADRCVAAVVVDIPRPHPSSRAT
jgi:hypothetical protein